MSCKFIDATLKLFFNLDTFFMIVNSFYFYSEYVLYIAGFKLAYCMTVMDYKIRLKYNSYVTIDFSYNAADLMSIDTELRRPMEKTIR